MENGLVVPATHIVCGKNKRRIQIFLDDAQKRKSANAAHMDVTLSEIDTYFYEELQMPMHNKAAARDDRLAGNESARRKYKNSKQNHVITANVLIGCCQHSIF